MNSATTQVVEHRRSDGVLCWGGPLNGEVVPIPEGHTVWLFLMPTRYTGTLISEPIEPTAPRCPTVRYDVERFQVRWSPARVEVWPVLVYPENKETQQRQLAVFANFLIWLASNG